jgi:hypothetical protein
MLIFQVEDLGRSKTKRKPIEPRLIPPGHASSLTVRSEERGLVSILFLNLLWVQKFQGIISFISPFFGRKQTGTQVKMRGKVGSCA